jgi:putative SOS response-associated peptidase YedK
MVTQLSLTYNRANVSRYILKNFLIENETALSILPKQTILPFQPLLTIIHTKQSYKLGNLNWGHPSSNVESTIPFLNLRKDKTLTRHFEMHRCLILCDAFSVKSSSHLSLTYSAIDHQTDHLFFLAGIYVKQIIEHKTYYFASLMTQSYKGHELPIVLNADQLHFYLNPLTIVDELNFLFYQHPNQSVFSTKF